MRSLVLVLVLSSATVAHADDASRADALFAEGVKLKEAGKNSEACAKFSETLQVNPNAVGAILNVALCDEEDGKYASATRLFAQARDLAREHDLQPQLKAAEEHLQKNEPLIAHIAIAFAEPPPADAKLVIDDQIVPIAAASDIPVDPGQRTVVVTAQGRVPFQTQITVQKTERKAIAVPKLGYPVEFKSTRRTYGIVITGVGVAAFVLGEAFGLKARSDYKGEFGGAMPQCVDASPKPKCTPDGYQVTHSAQQLGNVGTGFAIAGGVVTAIGVYVWFFAPKEQAERRVAITPVVAPGSAGVVAVGHF